MMFSVAARWAAVAAAAALALSACGSDTPAKQSPSTWAVFPSTHAAPPPPPPPPRTGPPTIRDYIADNGLQEAILHRGDEGAPVVDLPYMDGWEEAGDLTPEWAYSAIVYRGPRPDEYTPNIVVLLSKLTGNVDAQGVIDHAAGELAHLSGWSQFGEGETDTFGDYPTYQLGGTWVQDGVTKVVAQKTIAIPAEDGVFVLQINADGLESDTDILATAAATINEQMTISV